MEQFGLASDVRHGEVLVDEALVGGDEHEGDVRTIGRVQRPQLRVVLDALALTALPAETGGVDQDERRLAAPQHGVDRVPGRPRDVGDDHPLLADDRVQQARLADVRPAEDRDPDRVFADARRPGAGQTRDDRVQQVARPVPVQGRERYGLAEPEPVELERLEVARRIVDLVRQQEHGLAGAPEDRRHLLVAGGGAELRVDDEEDEVGLVDRGAGLDPRCSA